MNAWIELAKECTAMRRAVAAIVRRSNTPRLARGLKPSELAERRAAMRRGIAALANRDLLRGFNTWASEQASRGEKRHAVITGGVARQWHSACVDGWSSNARDRHKLIIAARRIVMRNMLQALSTWRAMAGRWQSAAPDAARDQRSVTRGQAPEGIRAWIEMAHERAASSGLHQQSFVDLSS